MPTFTRELRDELPILVVAGELDIYAQKQFADALHSLEESFPRVLVDFCRCRYFDSSALTELVRFRNARAEMQQVLLSVPNRNAQRILQISGLNRVFKFADCLHEEDIQLERTPRTVAS
jgi:anti-anti-sigma factor